MEEEVSLTWVHLCLVLLEAVRLIWFRLRLQVSTAGCRGSEVAGIRLLRVEGLLLTFLEALFAWWVTWRAFSIVLKGEWEAKTLSALIAANFGDLRVL